jgi:hypothetical protein
MRASTLIVGLASFAGSTLAAQAYGYGSAATTSASTSAVAVQQIGDGQIQNPVPAPPAPYTPVPVASAPPASYIPAPAPSAAPPAPAPPPSYSNQTAIITSQKTFTSAYVQPSAPVVPSATGSRPPVVQTGAANTIVGSAVGLGFAAFVAALLG